MVTKLRTRDKRPDITPDGFIQFGKHEGEHVSETPAHYLRWALEQPWISDRLRDAISTQLGLDRDECDAEPDPTPAAIAFPLIVFEWKRTMFRAFEGDRDALEVVGRGLRELKSLCSGLTKQPWPEDAEATP